MNTFSWMIYISSRYDILLGMLTTLSIAFVLCNFFCYLYNEDRDRDEKPLTVHKSIWWKILGIPLIVMVLLMPNERTILMIAASELGERAVHSEAFQTTLKKLTEEVK